MVPSINVSRSVTVCLHCLCVCVCVCARARARAHMRAYVCECRRKQVYLCRLFIFSQLSCSDGRSVRLLANSSWRQRLRLRTIARPWKILPSSPCRCLPAQTWRPCWRCSERGRSGAAGRSDFSRVLFSQFDYRESSHSPSGDGSCGKRAPTAIKCGGRHEGAWRFWRTKLARLRFGHGLVPSIRHASWPQWHR